MAIPVALSLLSVGAKAASTFAQIKSFKQEAADAKAISAYNAHAQRLEGLEGQKRLFDQAKKLRKSEKRLRGLNKAKGAPLAVLEENAVNFAIDQNTLFQEGSRLRNQADRQADITLLQGRSQVKAAKRNARTALIQGVTGMANSAFNF